MLLDHLIQSFRRPDHWLYGSWLDTALRYRKMRLGLLWLLIPTAVYIWGIGGFLASMQPGLEASRFLAHVGLSYILFRLLSTVMTDSTALFSGFQHYIYDGHSRLTDYVLRCLARSFYYFALSLPVALAVAAMSPAFTPTGIPLAALGLAVVLVNLFSISVMLAIAGARFPDLGELMGSVMMAALLITPVVWYPQNAPADTTPGMLMRANPLHHLLLAVRGPLLGERIDAQNWIYLAVLTVAGLIAAAAVYRGCARRVAAWL